MAEAGRRTPQAVVRRQRRRQRTCRLLFWALICLGTIGYTAQRWAAQHQIFVVETIRLEACPDALRGPAAAALQPLLGRTFFEVAARRDAMVQQLSRLPEVRGAELLCRPPATVAVKLLPRVPRFAVQAGQQWLSVDDTAVIVRVGPQPEPGLVRLLGVPAPVVTPGTRLDSRYLAAAVECRQASEAVLGQAPARIAFESGGGMRLRLATGALVLLGRPAQLEEKLHTYLVVRNRLSQPVKYVDVATPTVPAWRLVAEG